MSRFAALAAALLFPAFAAAAPIPAERPKNIDIALCLDVSNSMDGLIGSAKLRLWDVVNELAKVKPTPNLRVALYSYGHTSYPAANGWVRKDLDLTMDLDEVYAKLNALKTSGGEEYVARVTQAAATELKWSEESNALKVIFVCGNEPANQDKTVSLDDAASAAKKKGVIVNTIYCGAAGSGEANGYRDFATLCGGKYANIDQERSRQEVVIATPFDKQLVELSGKLNTTYVAFGKDGKEAAKKQLEQDKNAANAPQAPGVGGAKVESQAALARAESKANGLYRNATWDLLDKMRDDPKFDITKVKDEDLCEEMRKLKPEERLPYLKKKAEERASIQKEINDLSAKRAKFVAEEQKKTPKSDGEKALDEALRGIIRDQATAKGFETTAPVKK